MSGADRIARAAMERRLKGAKRQRAYDRTWARWHPLAVWRIEDSGEENEYMGPEAVRRIVAGLALAARA